MIIADAHYSDKRYGNPDHRKINYEICDAMDPTKFGIVLEQMVRAGMDPGMADIYEAQFQGLLAAVRTENNRIGS